MSVPDKSRILMLGAAVVALTLAGCTATASSGGAAPVGKIKVVASTDVWGDIAKQIGGQEISVTSVLSDPAQDPHSYEADAQVQLSLSRADLVIENGGGYDDFMDTLLRGASNSSATVLNAVTISGFHPDPATGELNEHVWYDFTTVRMVASRITNALSARDKAQATSFQANEKSFDAALAVLEADEAAIKASPAAGSGVAITEPVPLYMLTACGLVNKTPREFSKAIEDGTDVAPNILHQTLALFTDRQVKLLAYNAQTAGSETDQVVAAAKAAGVAIVPVTETLPSGKSYLRWMTDNLSALRTALG
jgi:zinc/manganese transport system substrate-binding protein